jgi:succinoglycan biosynthesis transport protein ExoP
VNNAVEIYRDPRLSGHLVPYEQPPQPPKQDRIDLRMLLAMFRRRRRLFLTVLAAVMVLGTILTLMMSRTYTAMSQVSLNVAQQAIAPTSTDQPQQNAPSPNTGIVNTAVQIIASRELAQKVSDQLNLASPDKADADKLGLKGRLLKAVGLWNQPVLSPAERQRAVLDYLQANVTPLEIGESFAISITFKGGDPQNAAAIANAYANQFTLYSINQKQAFTKQQNQFLSGKLEQVRQQAQADTDRVQQYRIAHGLLSTTGASLTEQEISAYNQQVAQAKAAASEADAALATAERQVSSGSSGDDVGAALSSGVVSSLRSQQASLAAQLANLTAHYGPRYPDVISTKSQLEDVNKSIAAEIHRVISNLTAQSNVAHQRLDSLVSSLQTAQGTLAKNNGAEVGLDDLTRRATASQTLYDSYLNSYKEVSAREGTEQPDASIISYAEVPILPTSPNIFLNIILMVGLGVGLGIAAAFFAEMTFAGLTTGDDVEHRLGVRHLGNIPRLNSVLPKADSPIQSIVDEPRSAFAESFRSVRASIRYSTDGPTQIIAITSALPKEGKTTTAVCLARSIAQTGESVVLVDCDLRRHGVSRLLSQAEGRPGLVEVLNGTASLDDALVRDTQAGTSVLPIAGGSENYAELLTGEKLDVLLSKLRERFSTIILDTAPVLPIADARLVVGKADVAVFVARWRKTPDNAIKAALRLMPADRVQLAGVALTNVDIQKQAKFGVGDGTYYYDDYKEYYA